MTHICPKVQSISNESASDRVIVERETVMGNSPLVTVIVPVYNVEHYIRHTITSILAQDHKNLEIILVDDGSPDDCPSILDEFARRDSRVLVIHQENAGVSSARNAGLDVASGEFIMFVDGDDWVEKDYVSYFLDLLEKTHCSVGMSQNIIRGNAARSEGDSFIVSAEKAIEWIYLDRINVAVWNKIFRADLIRASALRFNSEIWYGEGMLFNVTLLQIADAVAIGDRPVYHQVFNTDSAMRKFRIENNLCGLRSLELQKEEWVKVTPEIEEAWDYHRYSFNRSLVAGLVRSNTIEENRDLYEDCIKRIRKHWTTPMRVSLSLYERLKWVLWIASPVLAAKLTAGVFRKRAMKQRAEILT